MTNVIFLLISSMTVNLIGTVIKKQLTNNSENTAEFGYLFNTVTSAVAALVLFVMNGFSVPSVFTIVLGLFFGVVTAIGQISNVQALKFGPLSYTTVLGSLSTLIPTLCGVLIWQEKVAVIQGVGIILMIGCFLLSVLPDPQKKKTSVRWLFYCAVLFLCTGGIGVMQKWHQNTIYKDELDAFLLIAFAFSTVYSMIGLLFARKKQGGSDNVEEGKKHFIGILILMAVCGTCAALNNKWNLYLSGVMDSAVFFPIVNGGGLVLTTLSALLLFKEWLSLRHWLGMLLGTLSVIFLCNPFA